ncbi:substrate-binding domain-containing protein [Streptomyces rubrogriseus]|uniref:substrate-binding domain-containing protein n=1 Tax=Streptomyces rubrogriseus TaxID=194673 RepID=UPI0036FA69E4
MHYLVDLGHRRFCMERVPRAGPLPATGARCTWRWWTEWDWSPAASWTAAGPCAPGTRRCDLSAESGVTAVLAANDYVTMGIIRGFQDRSMDVPGDVSVFDWDNEQFPEYLRPTMSTVRPDRETLGRQAMQVLLARIQDQPAQKVHIGEFLQVVPCEFSGEAPCYSS